MVPARLARGEAAAASERAYQGQDGGCQICRPKLADEREEVHKPVAEGPSSIVACPSCGKPNRVPAAATGSPRCARCRAALPWIVDADDASFAEVAERSPLPVVVDLWAPWCGPCRVVGPVLAQLATELAGRCKLVKVNVDRAPAIQARFSVRSIPTLVVMRGGREVARQVGAAPADRLRSGWRRRWPTPPEPSPGAGGGNIRGSRSVN